jgi:hypothetical protein
MTTKCISQTVLHLFRLALGTCALLDCRLGLTAEAASELTLSPRP